MNILDRIIAQRKQRIAHAKKRIPQKALNRTLDTPEQFINTRGITLIAECKKGSPSKGVFLEEYDPVLLAGEYELGGAHALSVLTEPDFFYGNNDHLSAVKGHVALPVLRKDFIIDPYQIQESWAIGADAVLLIAAILSDMQMQELALYAKELRLEVLLEIHDEYELERALRVPASGIGINARNLKDFTIDLGRAKELCKYIPKNTVAVTESGLKSATAGMEMHKAGFRGFLVGEYFIRARNRVACVREFADALKR